MYLLEEDMPPKSTQAQDVPSMTMLAKDVPQPVFILGVYWVLFLPTDM